MAVGSGRVRGAVVGAGHMGPSGRYNAWRDEAFVLAWVLDTLRVHDGADGPPA